jgi:predicted nucleotidyltransferase
VNLVTPSLNASIAEIRKIVPPIAERHGVEHVYLFGSRARGDHRPDSDYDFMVSFGSEKCLLHTLPWSKIWKMLLERMSM